MLEIGGNGKYPASTLIASSANRGWETISAELRAHPRGEISLAYQSHVEIVLLFSSDVIESATALRDNALLGNRSASGAIWLLPIGMQHKKILIEEPITQALHLYLSLRQFDALIKQFTLSASPIYALQYTDGLHDDLIYQIGLALWSELVRETVTGRMFVETSSRMLAARLINKYSDGALRKPAVASSQKLDMTKLARVMDHIDRYLEGNISVADLADAASLSLFHFTRRFTATIGVAPYRYVSQKRLERAVALLTNGEFTLDEIAHKTRFASQASFNRAFRRATGMTPGQYRRLATAQGDRAVDRQEQSKT